MTAVSALTETEIKNLTDKFEDLGFRTHLSTGTETTIIGLIGDTSKIDVEDVAALDIVEKVQRVSEPYKLVNRKFHNDDTVIFVTANAFPISCIDCLSQ